MCVVGTVKQRMERLESSQKSTESHTMLVENRVHHLQGDYWNVMFSFDIN